MPPPIVVATVQAAMLSGISNILAQAVKSYKANTPLRLDLIPVAHFIFFALLMCPPNYLWQRYLEETFPTRTTTAKTPPSGDPKPEAASPSHSIDGDAPIPVFNVGNIAKKFALDQTLGAVVNTVLFLAVMGGLKGASGQEITDRVHKDLWSIMKDGWRFWPAVSIVMFTAVPFKRRMLAGNLVSMLWNIYLSLVAAR